MFIRKTNLTVLTAINNTLVRLEKENKIPYKVFINNRFCRMGASDLIERFMYPQDRTDFDLTVKEIKDRRDKNDLTKVEKGMIQAMIVIAEYERLEPKWLRRRRLAIREYIILKRAISRKLASITWPKLKFWKKK